MYDLKIFTDNIEGEALNQIYTLVKQPAFSNCKVRIMPDVHAGAGCVIGFTADLGDKVIPNIVGVDIGCGMLTVELGPDPIDFADLDRTIRTYVPSGRAVHEGNGRDYPFLLDFRCFNELREKEWLERSLGTLGGGNHFIEIDVDSNDNKYLIIHTGSRNLGKQVADIYQKKAIDKMMGHGLLRQMQEKLIEEYKAAGRTKEISGALAELSANFSPNPYKVPKELCYLEGQDRIDYLHDMRLCQEFASMNRYEIANTIIGNLYGADMAYWDLPSFETIHNYIEFDSNIVRKGAISAKAGEQVLIPLNMRDGCILGVGKGNPDWNYSAPHGAGRLFSRMQAKKNFNVEEFKNSMEGIYTTSINEDTLDECPMAYKNMDDIVNNITPTAEIIKIIKPIYNFKAGETTDFRKKV